MKFVNTKFLLLIICSAVLMVINIYFSSTGNDSSELGWISNVLYWSMMCCMASIMYILARGLFRNDEKNAFFFVAIIFYAQSSFYFANQEPSINSVKSNLRATQQSTLGLFNLDNLLNDSIFQKPSVEETEKQKKEVEDLRRMVKWLENE